MGHPPRSVRSVTAETRNCVNCHQPHGSANATLVPPNIPRFGRANPITFTGAGGAVPGGFVDPTDPGHGLCEVCHRKTDFYLASGAGKPHFTDDCTLCHDHTVAFQAVVSLANCPICHADEAARFEEASRHSSLFVCTNCHTDTGTTPGPGHETVPSCGQCHSTIETHAPAGRPPFPCTQCHNPHGTTNIKLVLEAIVTPQGPTQPVVFTSLAGKADGSFASVSAPGTGVCEICHTTTNHYRADGGGSSHLTSTCTDCHSHSDGFRP